jgi:TolB-like protein/Tfp pilus assembly protein PilF
VTIEAGQHLHHYRLIEKIGEGGMGVVWKASDTKLDREVAIKFLPHVFSKDPERLARFKREAKLLASVNHPGVAAIYGFETVDNIHFLVLELVPGQGLDEMLRDGPLPVSRALDISRSVAEGLQAAHATGIIHRDLKPANVKITPDGTAKVLDFGLAKVGDAPATPGDTSLSPTVTHAGTQMGVVLGTAPYMSPEQARGLALDKRTDIWSFGCLLYECLTATKPFAGKTVSDSIAKILGREPDWKKLPAATPLKIHDLLHQCLQKDPDRRLPDMTDAIRQIQAALHEPATATKAWRKGRPLWLAAPVVILGALAIYLLATFREPAPPAGDSKKMIAVLPFENMGPAEDEYFADGITEEISARLAAVRALGVIGRTSAMQYKQSGKSVQQIGEELDIDYVLDGTVRWQRAAAGSSRVRVTPQLIRVSDATQLWAEIYEAEMSDIFEVQSEIAGQVARALDVTLGESGQRVLEARPTEDLQAYDFYLRGEDYWRDSYEEEDFSIAQQMFEQAVDLDPGFALAYAKLGLVHDSLYWFHFDRTPERLARSKAAIDKALKLDPDLPEAHVALGWYYYHGFLDYESALRELAIAEASLPDNLLVLEGIASVRRRQGRWEDALSRFRRVAEIDPRSKGVAKDLNDTTLAMRLYSDAERWIDLQIALAPDDRTAYISKAWLQVTWTGSTERAREVLDDALGDEAAVDTNFGSTLTSRIRLNMFDAKYQAALDLLSLETSGVFMDNQYVFVPTEAVRAEVHGLMGRPELERQGYESARATLEAMLDDRPDDARLHGALGIAFAGLGRKEDAVRAAKRGVELLPVSKEAWRGVYRVQDLARVYAMVGEHDLAIDRLVYLLSVPGELSPHLLRLDPTWHSLHDQPRFRELVEEIG